MSVNAIENGAQFAS